MCRCHRTRSGCLERREREKRQWGGEAERKKGRETRERRGKRKGGRRRRRRGERKRRCRESPSLWGPLPWQPASDSPTPESWARGSQNIFIGAILVSAGGSGIPGVTQIQGSPRAIRAAARGSGVKIRVKLTWRTHTQFSSKSLLEPDLGTLEH